MALTNVMEITMADYIRLLDFTIKTGGNMMAFGQAGVGKTEVAEQRILLAGYNLILVNVATLEYTDFVGLPTIVTDTDGYKYSEYATPRFIPRPPTPLTLENLEKSGLLHKKTVFLFDEIDKGKPEIQNPALEMFQRHSLNGSPIDAQAFIATGNLPDENAFSRPVSHALTNRCMVYKVVEDFEAWMEHSQLTGLHPLVRGFLSKHIEHFSEAPPDDRTAYSRGSPRSWTLAGQDLSKADALGMSDLDFQTSIVAGRVGTQGAMAFRIWLEHYRKVEDQIEPFLLENKQPPRLEFLQHIFIFGLMSASHLVRQMNKVSDGSSNKQEFKENFAVVQKMTRNLFSWLRKLNSPDISVAVVKTAFSSDMAKIREYKLIDIGDFMEVFSSVRKIMA